MPRQPETPGAGSRPDRAGRRWPQRLLSIRPTIWSSVAGRLAVFSALAFVAVVLVSASAVMFADGMSRTVGSLVPAAAAVNATTTRLHALLDRERGIIDGLIGQGDEANRARVRRMVAPLVTDVGACLAGKDGCVAPPAGLAGAIDAGFAAVRAAGADATRPAGTTDRLAGNAIARFNMAVNRLHVRLGEWQERKFAGLLDQLKTLIAGTRRVALDVIAGAIGSLLVGLLGLIAVYRMLGRQRRLTIVMLHLARGGIDYDVPFCEASGEIGQMARALDVFVHTARRLAASEADLRQVNERIDAALNNMSHGVCMYDAANRLMVCNAGARRILGLAPDLRLEGLTCFELVELAVSRGGYGRENAEGVKERLRANLAGRVPVDYVQELADGRVLSHWITPMSDGGWVSTFEDITERRAAEARLAHMAHHDALTGLANRVLLRAELQKAATRAGDGESFAVLCIDLDHFKEVNDTLGHPMGDALLQVVTARLRGSVRESDLVARLGGDEFAIIQTVGGQSGAAADLAGRILTLLAVPFDLNGHRIAIGASIGVALAPADGTDPDELMRKADLALYQAKANGRGTYRLFEPAMSARLQAHRGMESDLRSALANGEFEMHYQAQIDLVAREIIGFEALLRWHAPGLGLVPPEKFIPLAEASGMIVPIGAWALRRACAEAATWPDHLSVAVNLSAVQFRTPGLVQSVRSALDTSGLAPNRLELEITESAMMEYSGGTLQTLHDLRALGVRIAMDDFGTGYSSLSYLQRFRFDKIKIDQSFVRGLADQEGCGAIVRAVAGLGRSLGIETVAEGIETEAQFRQVRADGCEQGQGFLFSRPLAAAEIPALLRHAAGRARGDTAPAPVGGG